MRTSCLSPSPSSLPSLSPFLPSPSLPPFHSDVCDVTIMCSLEHIHSPIPVLRTHSPLQLTWPRSESPSPGPPGQSCGLIYVNHLLYQYPALPCLVPLLPADPCSHYQKDGHSLCHPCKTIQVCVAVVSFLHLSREGGTEPNAKTGHPGYAAVSICTYSCHLILSCIKSNVVQRTLRVAAVA